MEVNPKQRRRHSAAFRAQFWQHALRPGPRLLPWPATSGEMG